MADVAGVKIIDLTAAGSSDDGEHVWITHRLGDGSEYPLVYPYEAVGYLITVLIRHYSALDAYHGQYELARLKRKADLEFESIDVLVLPTTSTIYETAAVEADPFHLNLN